MKWLSWPMVVIFALLVFWFAAVVPNAARNAKRGFNAFQDSIPISGTEEERRISYEGEWTVFPAFCQINNLRIQGPRAEDESVVMYFNPDVTMEFIRFDPLKLMKDIEPEVLSIGHVNFNAKVHYKSLSDMLEERNPNFKNVNISMRPNDVIEISGRLDEVNSVVYISGSAFVNAAGELEFTIIEVSDFLLQKVTDSRKRGKVVDALDLKWRFSFMDVSLSVNRAAVSKLGVYIEAESSGWEKGNDENESGGS